MTLKHLLLAVQTCLLVILVGCANKQATIHTNEVAMTKTVINPWTWQNRFGFVQANEVTGAQRMLFCAGQISVDDNGNLLHPNDMEKQIIKIADNMETLFAQSNVQLSDIVKITYYTTDINAFTKANLAVLVKRLKKWGCKPATSLIGVAALARPGCVVELEATALSGPADK